MLFHDLISGDELLADAAALLTNRLELVDKGLVELELFCVETCGGGTGLRKHICTVHGRDVALRDEQLGRRVEALDEALSRARGPRCRVQRRCSFRAVHEVEQVVGRQEPQQAREEQPEEQVLVVCDGVVEMECLTLKSPH